MNADSKTVPSAAHGTLAERPSGAVRFWAVIGTGALALAVTTYGRWLVSSDFSAPDPAPDHYQYLWALRAMEVVSVLFVAGFLWFCLLRPLVREHRFTFDGKLLLGLLIAYVVDPTFNIFNHSFAMNAYSINAGAWGDLLPGMAAPGQGRLAEAVAWAAPLYVYCGIAAAMLGCRALAALRRRFPQASTTTLWAVLYAGFVVGDFFFEFGLFVAPQLYVFPGVKGDWSLFSGTLHQFPVYHSLLAGVFACAITWLRDSRDESGRSAVELGAGVVSGRASEALSFLAITGYATCAAFLGYFAPFAYLSMQADTYTDLPSYLDTAAYCGDVGKPECPAQYLNNLKRNYQEGP
jgi:hypothetical protein